MKTQLNSRTLNYKHLYYFYVVAREGGISKAAQRIHLTPQTISGQITQFEDALGVKLFQKVGRGLRLSETGQMVLRYAQEIFTLGEALESSLYDGMETAQKLVIGVLDSIPKLIAYHILKPIMQHEAVAVTFIEGSIDRLLADLAIHKLDMVLADVPASASYSIKAFNHLLGESPLTCFGTKAMAARYRSNFPASLAGAPMLLPTRNSVIGLSMQEWLRSKDLKPAIRGYFDDSALMKAFGQAGEGLFFMPSVIENEICDQFGVSVIGRVDGVTESYYAITVNRRIRHPALVAICDKARKDIFN